MTLTEWNALLVFDADHTVPIQNSLSPISRPEEPPTTSSGSNSPRAQSTALQETAQRQLGRHVDSIARGASRARGIYVDPAAGFVRDPRRICHSSQSVSIKRKVLQLPRNESEALVAGCKLRAGNTFKNRDLVEFARIGARGVLFSSPTLVSLHLRSFGRLVLGARWIGGAEGLGPSLGTCPPYFLD